MILYFKPMCIIIFFCLHHFSSSYDCCREKNLSFFVFLYPPHTLPDHVTHTLITTRPHCTVCHIDAHVDVKTSENMNLFCYQGNELFKSGAHEEAVERYSLAIQLDPTSAILPANRALALIKLER